MTAVAKTPALVVSAPVPLPAAPRAGTLAAAILDALQDDTMTAHEIARQLHKRGNTATPAQLAVALRRMWTAGHLRERTILGVQCWRGAL